MNNICKFSLFFLIAGCSTSSPGEMNQFVSDTHGDLSQFLSETSDIVQKDLEIEYTFIDTPEDTTTSIENTLDLQADITATGETKSDVQKDTQQDVQQNAQNADIISPCIPTGICDDCFSCTDDSSLGVGICTSVENNGKCDDGIPGNTDKCNPWAPGADIVTGCVHY